MRRCNNLPRKTKATPQDNTIKYDKYGNEKSNSKVMAKQIKVKKVISNDTMTNHIKDVSHKRGKPKTKMKYVLPITDWL